MMLAELKAHHRRVLDAINEIGRVVDGAPRESSNVAAARLALSKASNDRARYISEKIYPFITERANQQLLAELVSLSRDFLAQRQASSKHVTTWTSKAIEADWAGYQAASRCIRRMMINRIELEKQVLYPSLRAP